MAVHRRPPESTELQALSEPRPFAITMYGETAPEPEGRDTARTRLKSGFDEAIRRFEAAGARFAELQALRSQGEELNADQELWRALSRSLAVFMAPGFSEVYVVHNRLRDELVTGDRFALGQLYRTVSYDQGAFAVSLSSDDWGLWQATRTDRAARLQLDGDYPADAAAGSNRDEIGGRDRPDLSQVGDEGKKTFLDVYAKRVADAVTSELQRRDPAGRTSVFVFAPEPLLSMFGQHFDGRRVVNVPGASDRLNAAEIDAVIRDGLADLDRQDTEAALRALDDGDQGFVERDLVAMGRAVVESAVDTLYFDDAAKVGGWFDAETGELRFEDDAPNVLPQLAGVVRQRGGRVVAVRVDQLPEGLWRSPAIARRRFSVT